MEPRIQYATTKDGVRIAYGEAGEGMPIVTMTPPGFMHAEIGWQIYPMLQGSAARFRSLWIDLRGTGLSDRSAADFSMEAMLLDLEALVERSAIQTFVLAAWTSVVPVAVTYAVAHPDRVSHLILTDGITRFSDFSDTPMYRAAMGLMDIDWQIYTDTFGQVLWAFPNPEFGHAFGELMRASSDPQTHRAAWKAWEEYDVVSLLPSISAPTLVVHNKRSRLTPAEVSQRIAAMIPHARFATIDDFTYSVLPDMIERFVQETSRSDTSPPLPSGTAIILFADIAGSTALTERLGDAAFRAKARELGPALRALVRECGGTPVEGPTLGDGVLAVFTSAREGIEAARRCGKAGDDAGLPLHLGLHAGDVTREKDPDGRDNVYGGAVNVAARISGLSAPGEVLVSETVRSLARTSAGVAFEDRGEQALKGVGEAVRVWAVREGVT